MEQSPSWDANSHSASEEIPYLLWKPKVHCSVHKSAAAYQIPKLEHYPLSVVPNYIRLISYLRPYVTRKRDICACKW